MCSTGPSMLTATVRLMTAEHNISVRVLNKDFQDWGGVYKVSYIQYTIIYCINTLLIIIRLKIGMEDLII